MYLIHTNVTPDANRYIACSHCNNIQLNYDSLEQIH